LSQNITTAESKLVTASGHQKLAVKLTALEPLTEGAPLTLWLSISENKEYPLLYRHAWGSAHVSTREDGADSFPIETLRLRIEMPGLTGPIVDDQTRQNSADCPADCKFAGTIAGDFTSRWDAWATHPGYGTWSSGNNW
jgi:hypothetical protein